MGDSLVFSGDISSKLIFSHLQAIQIFRATKGCGPYGGKVTNAQVRGPIPHQQSPPMTPPVIGVPPPPMELPHVVVPQGHLVPEGGPPEKKSRRESTSSSSRSSGSSDSSSESDGEQEGDE